MKSSLLLPLCAAAVASAVHAPEQVPLQAAEQGEYLIELAPGETRWITEDDKWALRRVGYLLYRLAP